MNNNNFLKCNALRVRKYAIFTMQLDIIYVEMLNKQWKSIENWNECIHLISLRSEHWIPNVWMTNPKIMPFIHIPEQHTLVHPPPYSSKLSI